jgi:IMP dehydrogenase
MSSKFEKDGLTFDDVLLIPGKSDVLPTDVDTMTRLTDQIRLRIPIVSAAMDMVTESRMGIALAREGGLGIIHRNLSIDDQAREVDRVKRSEAGMIAAPVTLSPEDTLAKAEEVMASYHISGVPVTDAAGKLVGILTNRDMRFETDLGQRIADIMTKDNLITAPVGTTLEQATEILRKHKVEKLPVVDEQGMLRGLITVKDILKPRQFPHSTKDDRGRLRVGAAVGVGQDALNRAMALVKSDVDLLVVDVAQGHSTGVVEIVRAIKQRCQVPVVAGNVATAEATQELIDAGADVIKVGVGPASICTTRVIAGSGVPQLTAVYDCSQVAAKRGVSLIADGGIRYSGDIAKAIAAGADCVMVGSLLAGTDESPGDVVFYQGERFKEYRGMGSIAAMKARGFSRDRYGLEGVEQVAKLVPEGIEGVVRYKGPLAGVVLQLIGGLQGAMHYVGARSIAELKENGRFVRVTGATLRESHPHDVVITKDAPNYEIR